MIYTDMTKKAMKLCFEAHSGQHDKSGVPYVFHPIHVAEQMDDEASTVVALLHDVVEDTEFTIDDLKDQGYSGEVLDALVLLTHDPDEPYLKYIERVRENPIARKVKLADLAHNSDPTRLDREPTEKDLERLEKYSRSIEILSAE